MKLEKWEERAIELLNKYDKAKGILDTDIQIEPKKARMIFKELIKDAEKEVFDDKGCHVEGAIAKALEEYGVKKNSYDMAFFIMKKLKEEFT